MGTCNNGRCLSLPGNPYDVCTFHLASDPQIQGTLCREQGHCVLFSRTGSKPTPYRATELISDSKNPLWPLSYILHPRGHAAPVAVLPTTWNLSVCFLCAGYLQAVPASENGHQEQNPAPDDRDINSAEQSLLPARD